MADWDFILAPSTVSVEVTLDEVAIVSNTLKMIKAESFHNGLHEWINETARKLSPEQHKLGEFVAWNIDRFVLKSDAKTFPDFIKSVADLPPEMVIDNAFHWFRERDDYPGKDVLLNDLDAYLSFAERCFAEKYSKKEEEFHTEEWTAQWEMLQNPEQFMLDAVEYMQFVWDNYLQTEWHRVKPMLQEAVNAFSELDYEGMSPYEAIETITGRNMRGRDFFEDKLAKSEKLIFMPSAHLGPYISWGASPDDQTMIFFFGARLPKNATMKSTALSRSELLVRLNALADETRLKILEMLTETDELCAQDFITGLDLSQSSASRHLRQLTASGYLTERRRDVAKCYSINPDRIDDTIQALKLFLKKN